MSKPVQIWITCSSEPTTEITSGIDQEMVRLGYYPTDEVVDGKHGWERNEVGMWQTSYTLTS